MIQNCAYGVQLTWAKTLDEFFIAFLNTRSRFGGVPAGFDNSLNCSVHRQFIDHSGRLVLDGLDKPEGGFHMLVRNSICRDL